MKPYLLFVCEECYPSGGWYDFIGSFDSTEDAIRQMEIYVKNAINDPRFAQIVFERKIIKTFIYGNKYYLGEEDNIGKWIEVDENGNRIKVENEKYN